MSGGGKEQAACLSVSTVVDVNESGLMMLLVPRGFCGNLMERVRDSGEEGRRETKIIIRAGRVLAGERRRGRMLQAWMRACMHDAGRGRLRRTHPCTVHIGYSSLHRNKLGLLSLGTCEIQIVEDPFCDYLGVYRSKFD